MHDAHMKMLARILGEIYRIQNATEGMTPSASGARVYGLLNGFEVSIDRELERAEGISNEKLDATMDVLEEIQIDEKKMADFTGFYDIEPTLLARGVNRADAIQIFTYLKANDQFSDLIEKMDSSNSPQECRTFKIYDYEK